MMAQIAHQDRRAVYHFVGVEAKMIGYVEQLAARDPMLRANGFDLADAAELDTRMVLIGDGDNRGQQREHADDNFGYYYFVHYSLLP